MAPHAQLLVASGVFWFPIHPMLLCHGDSKYMGINHITRLFSRGAPLALQLGVDNTLSGA
jgi:hypothetical protein